jgi:hypothetical protein
MSLDTEAPLASVSAAHLYTMPGTGSVHTALDLDEGLDGCVASLPPSPIDVAGPQGLYT